MATHPTVVFENSAEEVHAWLTGPFPVESDEEGVMDWLGPIASGVATGATTGLAAGPWGALVGGIVGGGLGAAQAAIAQQQPKPSPSPPKASPTASSTQPAAQPKPQQPTSAVAGTSRPQSGAPSSSSGSSGVPPQLVQQLVQILPLLTQLASQLTASQGQSEPQNSEEQPVRSGDYVPDSAFMANGGRLPGPEIRESGGVFNLLEPSAFTSEADEESAPDFVETVEIASEPHWLSEGMSAHSIYWLDGSLV